MSIDPQILMALYSMQQSNQQDVSFQRGDRVHTVPNDPVSFLSNPVAGINDLVVGRELSPYEQLIQQQTQAFQQVLPQLQQEARGVPSEATRNALSNLRQSTTSAQQSYAASATARGAGGTPVAAQQSRFRASEQQTAGNILAQAQANAINQIASGGRMAIQSQGQLEEADYAAQQQYYKGLGTFLGWYLENRDDPQGQQMYQIIKDEMKFADQFQIQGGTNPMTLGG